jgi:predicted kinase
VGRPPPQRHRDTILALVAGFAGSGKMEFSAFLSSVTGWALLDKDVLTRPLVESMLAALGGDPNDRQSPLYLSQVRPVEYRCLSNATFANIENGISTVVTAPFLAEVTDPQWVRCIMHRCAAASAHLEIVWLGADAETMHTNLQRRDAARHRPQPPAPDSDQLNLTPHSSKYPGNHQNGHSGPHRHPNQAPGGRPSPTRAHGPQKTSNSPCRGGNRATSSTRPG